jgi:hypothetical protein
MAATPQSQSAEDARRPRLYDFAEGYGSIYGRYVRKRLSQRLTAENGIRTVLEAPCNAEAYFASPGTQSVVFAEAGCSVALVHQSEEVVQKTRDFWAQLGMPDTPVIHVPDAYHLPFDDNQFDLVWNFDSVPLFDDPARFIEEMVRVSRSLVWIIVANTWNIGYPIHALSSLLSHRPSPWGSRAWMSMRPIERVLGRLGLTTVERGLVDMPPWPGFDAMNLVMQLLRRSSPVTVADDRTDIQVERMLDKLTFIEYAQVPSLLKVPFSHQQYILARKNV